MTVETTHFLYLATPPRPTFVMDATPAEYAVLEQHFAYLRELRDRKQLLLGGPSLDGKYGVVILTVTDPKLAQEIVDNDPAVTSGLFRAALHPLSVGVMADA